MDMRNIPDKDLALMKEAFEHQGFTLFRQYVAEDKLKAKQNELNTTIIDSQDKVLRFSHVQGYLAGTQDVLGFPDRIGVEFRHRNDK